MSEPESAAELMPLRVNDKCFKVGDVTPRHSPRQNRDRDWPQLLDI